MSSCSGCGGADASAMLNAQAMSKASDPDDAFLKAATLSKPRNAGDPSTVVQDPANLNIANDAAINAARSSKVQFG
jgi:hypothetical protein